MIKIFNCQTSICTSHPKSGNFILTLKPTEPSILGCIAFSYKVSGGLMVNCFDLNYLNNYLEETKIKGSPTDARQQMR